MYKIKEKKLDLHSFLIICVLNMFIWNDFKEQRSRGLLALMRVQTYSVNGHL